MSFTNFQETGIDNTSQHPLRLESKESDRLTQKLLHETSDRTELGKTALQSEPKSGSLDFQPIKGYDGAPATSPNPGHPVEANPHSKR